MNPFDYNPYMASAIRNAVSAVVPQVPIAVDSGRRVSAGRRRILPVTVQIGCLLQDLNVAAAAAPSFVIEGMLVDRADMIAGLVQSAEAFSSDYHPHPPIRYQMIRPGQKLTLVVRNVGDEPRRFFAMWWAIPVAPDPPEQCFEHEDCRAHPELGRACWEAAQAKLPTLPELMRKRRALARLVGAEDPRLGPCPPHSRGWLTVGSVSTIEELAVPCPRCGEQFT